jgi:hypothetical protein
VSGKQKRTRPIVWIGVTLLLLGAVMLLASVEAAGLWIAVITVGIALVVIYELRGRHSLNFSTDPGRSPTSSADAAVRR